MSCENSAKIYFGRPINTYADTQLYEVLSSRIIEFFRKQGLTPEIVDPSISIHQAGYTEYAAKTGFGMEYFLSEVLPTVFAGVFLAFSDGMIGAGVWREAEFLNQQGKPIFEIQRSGEISPLVLDESRRLDVVQTRSRLRGS